MSDFSDEEKNYFYMVKIVNVVVSEGLRTIFKEKWNIRYQATLGAWDNTVASGQMLFNMEKGRRTATRYLGKYKNGNLEELDNTVLFDLILYSNSIGKAGLSHVIRKEVDNLRVLRNLIAHSQCHLSEIEFKDASDKVRQSFLLLRLPTKELDDIMIRIKPVTYFEILRAFFSNLFFPTLSSISDDRRKVQWRQTSEKHRPKFEDLVKILETSESSEVIRIGTYRVCFKREFAIGNGCDGTTVYIGLSDDGFEVAVKSIPINVCEELGLNEQDILNCPNVRKEPHIVSYRFYTSSVDSMHAYLVLDLHEESLKDYVKERSKDELKERGPTIMRQILLGLQALHCGNEEILHRDLKPANVLVSVTGEMVLADFGISRKLPKGQTTWRSGPRGTEYWIAVESLSTDESDDDSSDEPEINVRYKKQSDIQVTGMLLFYILTKGRHAYGKRNNRRSNLSNANPVNLRNIDDPAAKDLIGWMLQHDPKDRPDVQQCLRHPYLLTATKQFHLVSSVGNEPEMKPPTYDANSVVVQQLNADPSLPKPSWKPMIDAEVMSYLTKHRPYSDNMADLLRLMRNTAQHWHDEIPPSSVQGKVVHPEDYFLKLFPTLPVVLHRIIRKEPDWIRRKQLKEFFMSDGDAQNRE